MQKKFWITTVIAFILGLVIGGLCIYFITKDNTNTPIENPTTENNENVNNEEENSSSLNLPTEGNNTVLTTKSNTTLRVVNEYDKSFFTKEKNLLVMFASWCPNCQEEISEIEKILKHYKNNKNVNVILIAHEYNDTVTDLINLIENNVDFGSTEVKIDLGRVIRKEIDPQASTIPISYVVNKNGKILESYNDSLTLEKAVEMVEK